MIKMILVISALTALLFAASFSTAMDDTGTLIKDKCISCHGLARTCTNLGKDLVWWQATVIRMKERKTQIDDLQVVNIAVYLAEPTEDFIKACD